MGYGQSGGCLERLDDECRWWVNVFAFPMLVVVRSRSGGAFETVLVWYGKPCLLAWNVPVPIHPFRRGVYYGLLRSFIALGLVR